MTTNFVRSRTGNCATSWNFEGRKEGGKKGQDWFFDQLCPQLMRLQLKDIITFETILIFCPFL